MPSCCRPIQASWQILHSACGLLFRLYQSQEIGREHLQFSRYGILDTVVTDNGPQFSSQEFRQFTLNWEFVHVSSSPHHHKSNAKVESAVKIAKSLIKKLLKDNKDPWLALLDQRNTPTESIGTSPAQRLMSCDTRTLLLTATNLLYPKVPESVTEKL